VFLPLVGALVMLAIPKSEETLHKVVALATSLVVFGVGVALLATSTTTTPPRCSSSSRQGVDRVINSRYIMGIDGISLPLIALTLFVVPLVIIYSWDHFPEPHNPKAFLIADADPRDRHDRLFVAQDLILFFVFFEVVLLPMYFMIGVWGGEQRKYASLKFFLYTLFGSALMIVAILAAVLPLARGQLRRRDAHTFSMIALSEWGGAGLANAPLI
jgi:NADH-quinone oxidoreductase subunit M